jgi:hypothetical protein
MREVLLRLVDPDPLERPSSKELLTQFQDKLYQDMIISNISEYQKILSFVFSDKNLFPNNVDFSISKHLSTDFNG